MGRIDEVLSRHEVGGDMGSTPRLLRYRFRWVGLVALISLCSPPTPVSADASTRPFWTEQAMFRFADDLFFIGRASCAATSEKGRQRAFARAVQELLNYTQRPGTAGLRIDTQMVFEERDSAGCPVGTVTVWRLLRLSVRHGARVSARSEPTSTTTSVSIAEPFVPLPFIGMPRDQVFKRFGLPRSIVVRRGTGVIWEYKQLGLTVEFDGSLFVKRWSVSTSQTVDHDSRHQIDSSRLKNHAAH